MAGGTLKHETIELTASDVTLSAQSGATNVVFSSGTITNDIFTLTFNCNMSSGSTAWVNSLYVHSAFINLTIFGREPNFGTGTVSTGNGIITVFVTGDHQLRIRYFTKSTNSEDCTIRIIGTLE